MSNKFKKFTNPALSKAIENSMPWLEKWQTFEQNIKNDIMEFEKLLNHKQISIITWVQIHENSWLGWAPEAEGEYMGLHYKNLDDEEVIRPLKACELEIQVMAFPYLSELSYQICARIKLAHTPNKILDEFAGSFLNPSEEEEVAPVQIATYT